MGGKIVDLVGKNFGRLVVVSLGDRVGERRRVAWNCLCECGKTTLATTDSLNSGMVKSCGCLRLDSLSSRSEEFQSNMLQKIFGRLTILRCLGVGSDGSIYECRCQCGNILSVSGNSLNRGHTKSCGCYHQDVVRQLKTTHGLSDHPLYDTWNGMIQRCTNPNATNYPNYGGRDENPISVCEEWKESPKEFIEWLESNEKLPGLTVDRRNNNGNYDPNNCGLATPSQQSRNKRTTKITIDIARKIKSDPRRNVEIAEEYGIGRHIVSQVKNGVTWKDA